MSEPVVAAKSSSAPVQANESIPSGDVTAGPHVKASARNRRVILAGSACVMAILALIAMPGGWHDEAPSAVDAPTRSVVAHVRTGPPSTQENVVVTPIEEQVVVRPVVQARLTAAGKAPSAVTTSSKPATSTVAPVTPDSAAASHANAPTINAPIAASPVVAPVVVKAEPVEETTAATTTVTITGCLEKRDDTFRLTDTNGDAPKSRSWKSGFLAKRPAAVELVDAASNLWLAAQVGQRVSATGTLDDRELHVRSVRRATGACQ